MPEEIIITYETLYELLRMEKTRPELQNLDRKFFRDVTNYIKEKNEILKSQQEKDSIFAPIEARKTKKQVEQIQKILKEIYEKREFKIVQLALIASRTDQENKNANSMLSEEIELYKELINNLNLARKGILFKLLEGKAPEIEKPKDIKTLNQPKNKNKLIKIVNSIPKFISTDLQVYGPLEKEDILNIDHKIADLLIKKEKAKEI